MLKIFDRLTGAQITVIAVALIAALVPGSLYAVAAFTNVAIQDPVSGYRARVDYNGKLQVGPGSVYQPYREAYEYYRLSPSYRLTIGFTADSNKVIYTVPSGYYAVIETLTGSYSLNGVSGGGFYLIGSSHGTLTSVLGTATPYAPIYQNFGAGFVMSSGETLSVDSRGGGNTGLYLHGYLIYSNFTTTAEPANVPAPTLAMTNVNAVTKNLPKTRESPP